MTKGKRNTSGLQPFTSERAREAASRPRVGTEPVVRRQFTLRPDQAAWLAEHAPNASELVRDLLDAHIAWESMDVKPNRMHYKGYTANVAYDDEDTIFYGRVIDIRDTITFSGASAAELRESFHTAVDDYLDFRAQLRKEGGSNPH